MTPATWRMLATLLMLLALIAHPHAASAPKFQIIHLADLHSAVDQYPTLLGALTRLQADQPRTPRLILINGDLFEAGDPIAARSAGQLDWVLLERLRSFGPVVLNIGNHEFDVVDPDALVSRAAELDIILVGNVALTDGSAPAPAAVNVTVGNSELRIVGVTTDQLATWPPRLREQLQLSEPASWIEEHWQELTAGAELIVLASHAGLQADRQMLATLARGPQPLLFFAAHDHLLLLDSIAGTPYVHSGSGAEYFALATIRLDSDAHPEAQITLIAAQGPEDAVMAKAVQQLQDTKLASCERQAVGWIDEAMALPDAARWASAQLQQDPGVDAVFLNHTSFGAGLPAGALSRYRFDRFLRFDNGLMQVEVDAATLLRIAARAQAQQSLPLAERSGDRLHGIWPEPEDGRRYRLLTSDWIAMPANQPRYLGETLPFEPVGGPSIKARLLETLQPHPTPDTR